MDWDRTGGRGRRLGALGGRTILLAVVAVACLAAAPWLARRNSPAKVMEATDDQFPVDYVCENCKHVFQMTYQQAWDLIRSGKAESPPGQYRRFECPKCGQVKAVCREALVRP